MFPSQTPRPAGLPIVLSGGPANGKRYVIDSDVYWPNYAVPVLDPDMKVAVNQIYRRTDHEDSEGCKIYEWRPDA